MYINKCMYTERQNNVSNNAKPITFYLWYINSTQMPIFEFNEHSYEYRLTQNLKYFLKTKNICWLRESVI